MTNYNERLDEEIERHFRAAWKQTQHKTVQVPAYGLAWLEAKEAITADRKRVALEARIGALDTIHKRLAASNLNTKHYAIISKMLIESKEGYREAMKREEV